MKQANEREPKQPKIHSCDGRGYFRELLDALPTAVYTTDANGRITFFSQAAVQLSGRTPEIGSDRYLALILARWPGDGA